VKGFHCSPSLPDDDLPPPHGGRLIDTVRAESISRMVDGITSGMPWQGRFWDYAVRGGMRVPLQGEAAWILPQGVKPYWRGTSKAVAYEFSP
jgi:hypothetical protein